MRSGIVGMVISFILAFVMLAVTPMYYRGIIEQATTQHAVQTEIRNIVDEVIDTRVLTDQMLADFNLRLASKSSYLRATVIREVEVINPDPMNPGFTYTTHMVTDNNRTYNQGDYITVTVDQIGLNFFQVVAMQLLGLNIRDMSVTSSARVR